MNAQLNQLKDRVERWVREPLTDPAPVRDIAVIARILQEVVYNLELMDKRLEAAEGLARHANDTASCLANGIQPD